ncbi:hypothetical protein AgCh_016661 [Apium graveolens]
MPSSLTVAVIGAGVAGLLAGHELQRAGHRVTIFGKQNQLGGTWVYDPRIESDLLSLDPDREIIHSSLYSSLCTNFPRHLMGFSDFSFTKVYQDSRTFPSHEEVLKFLNEFALQFGIIELIRFSTEVVGIELRDNEWIVESRTSELTQVEGFDAVVVCNGHHTEPRVANFPGIEKWPGMQIHSHNYRDPEPFRDQMPYSPKGQPTVQINGDKPLNPSRRPIKGSHSTATPHAAVVDVQKEFDSGSGQEKPRGDLGLSLALEGGDEPPTSGVLIRSPTTLKLETPSPTVSASFLPPPPQPRDRDMEDLDEGLPITQTPSQNLQPGDQKIVIERAAHKHTGVPTNPWGSMTPKQIQAAMDLWKEKQNAEPETRPGDQRERSGERSGESRGSVFDRIAKNLKKPPEDARDEIRRATLRERIRKEEEAKA